MYVPMDGFDDKFRSSLVTAIVTPEENEMEGREQEIRKRDLQREEDRNTAEFSIQMFPFSGLSTQPQVHVVVVTCLK